MFEVSFPVRYYEADPMGVVHHSEYVRYFELARNEWLASVGFHISVLDRMHIVFPVIHLECDYKRSAHFGENLRATAEIVAFDTATVTFSQKVLAMDGTLYASGKVRLAFLNTALGHVVRCPEALEEVIDKQLNTTL